jgi:hypothetical protein
MARIGAEPEGYCGIPMHIVRQGGWLSSIAKKHGVADWRTIYNHPENARLRTKRPSSEGKCRSANPVGKENL